MKTSILFGNGLNRAVHSSISWNELLEKIMRKNIFNSKDLPNTLIYERIFLDRKKGNEEQNIKNEIAELLQQTQPNELYDEMLSLGCNNYLTTNYDYALEKSINLQVNIRSTEEIYSLRRFREYFGSNGAIRLWNVHGEIDHPKTIMLGLDHYCGAIAKLDSYIKGTYVTQRDGKSHHVEPMKTKLHNRNFCHTSWVDLFFSDDIHIIGLSLDFSETDLWWIINKRARLAQVAPVDNKIYFHSTNKKDEKSDLLNSFGVQVMHHPIIDGYIDAYKNMFSFIAKTKR
jgi:hypothetical protein